MVIVTGNTGGEEIELTLRLRAASMPPTGSVTAAGRTAHRFEGWLELYALVEEALTRGSAESERTAES